MPICSFALDSKSDLEKPYLNQITENPEEAWPLLDLFQETSFTSTFSDNLLLDQITQSGQTAQLEKQNEILRETLTQRDQQIEKLKEEVNRLLIQMKENLQEKSQQENLSQGMNDTFDSKQSMIMVLFSLFFAGFIWYWRRHRQAAWQGTAESMSREASEEESYEMRREISEPEYSPRSSKEDFSQLAGEDVIATKLDLAMAYINMEDYESSREILNEILEGGTPKQKEEAKRLLQQIK